MSRIVVALVMLGAAVGVTPGCRLGGPDPAEQAVEGHVEGFERVETDWDYEEADTPECRSYQERVDELYDQLSEQGVSSWKRSYHEEAADGTERSVMIRIENDSDGARFDGAIQLFVRTFTGKDRSTCLNLRFGTSSVEEIAPATRVGRGHSWAIRMIYNNGAVYRYDTAVWQTGDQMVWLHTWGVDSRATIEWARQVQRDAAARLARGEDP
ncbi:MAG: hypothetical protein ACRDHF_04590 [Tepidiformaceae bacterium]